MICYHHNDMDGKAAGFIVHKMKPSGIEDYPSDYIQCTYEDKFDHHTNKDDVFIVDLSISEATYPMLLETCRTARSVTWIDHHATSIDTVKVHEKELQSIDNLTYFISDCACGAALTYAYLSIPRYKMLEIRSIEKDERYNISAQALKGDKSPNALTSIQVIITKNKIGDNINAIWYDFVIDLPNWLAMVDDYDCWKKQIPDTDHFILGTDCMDTALTKFDKRIGTRFWNPIWEKWFNDSVSYHYQISDGKVIQRYTDSKYHKEMRLTFEWKYKGTTFLCKNGHGNSFNFLDSIKKYPAVILFYYNGKDGLWNYSVYSDEKSKFNCKAFCEKLGGGGHIHAAGFSSKSLIFINPKMAKPTEDVIFLGGTCAGYDWRSKFIDIWKKRDTEITNAYKLFNPMVEDWTEEDKRREDECKATAKLSFFLITPDMTGAYSLVEATECSHNSNTFLAIYNIGKGFDIAQMKSFAAIGDIVKKNGGTYKTYTFEDNNDHMEEIVNDVIAAI